MPEFTDLPFELRLKTFEWLIKDLRNSSSTSTYHLSNFTTVCKEWQDVFERETFRQLILSSSRVKDLYQNIKHRKGLVKHIHYYVELSKYYCPDCRERETYLQSEINNGTATRGIKQLFHVLSTWSKDGHGGLTLELSAFSPSDTKHHLENYQFGPFFYSDQDDFDCNPMARRLLPRSDDGAHGSHECIQRFPSQSYSLRKLSPRRRLEGSPLIVEADLAKVEVVTRLLIRRQSYRAFGMRTLSSMLRALPSMEQIHLEYWSTIHHIPLLFSLPESEDVEVLLRNVLSRKLKELTLYEEEDGFYEALKDIIRDKNRLQLPRIAAKVQGAGAQLESLAISFAIDARDFFALLTKYLAVDNFPRLEFCILTSRVLRRRNDGHINQLLHAAGDAALNMPKLRVMELWNAHRGEAAIFRYQQKPFNTVELACSSSWDFSLDPKVVTHWEKVALEHGCRELSTMSDRIEAPLAGPGSVLKYLHLRHRILNPLSLWQIQQEADDANRNRTARNAA